MVVAPVLAVSTRYVLKGVEGGTLTVDAVLREAKTLVVVPATRSRRTTAGPAFGFAPRLEALLRKTT